MEIQKLMLAEDVFDSLEIGKICTIRNGRRDIQLGELMFESTETHRTHNVMVHTVIFTELQRVPFRYVLNDGFISYDDMCDKLKRFYPDIKLCDEFTVVVF